MCEFLDFRSLDVSTGDKTTRSSRNVDNQLSSDARPFIRGKWTSTFDLFLSVSWIRPSGKAIWEN